MSEAAYTPIEWFNKEENYEQFIRVHGFDIRGELTSVHSTVSDTRDTRDPEQLGLALLFRPEGRGICAFADELDSML